MCQRSRVLTASFLPLLAALAACDRSSTITEVQRPATSLGLNGALDSQPVEADAAPPPAPRPRLSASLQRCDGPGCSLVISFSHPLVSPEALSKAKPPQLELRPKIRGRLRWRSPSELELTPRSPLKVGESVFVSLKQLTPLDPGVDPLTNWTSSVTVDELHIAGKVVGWPRVRGLPRLVTPLTQGDLIGPGGLLLVFDQPVEPSRLARSISAAGPDGTKLPLRLERPETVAPMYSEELDLSLVVRLVIPKLPAHGEQLTLSLPGWKEGVDGLPTASREERPFTAVRSVELVDAGFEDTDTGEQASPDRVPLHATWTLRTTQTLSAYPAARYAEDKSVIADLQSAFQLEPRPKSMVVQLGWASEVIVSLALEPGTSYRMTTHPLSDLYGNRTSKRTVKFRTRDLPPELLAPALPVVVERGAARLPLRVQNLGAVSAQLFRLEEPWAFLQPSGAETSCEGKSLGEPTLVANRGPLNQRRSLDVPLGKARGLYCVKLLADGKGSEARPISASALVQVSDLSATVKRSEEGLLVWATRLSDASPLAQATISVFDRSGARLAAATAGEDGVARLVVQAGKDEGRQEPWVVSVSSGKDTGVTVLDEERLSQPWHFGLPQASGAEPLEAALFTDRGAYRPGETVQVKLIAREREKTRLQILDPRGQSVESRTLALDAFGQGDLALALGEKAPVGQYTVRAEQLGRATSRSFRVEEFRVPTFEVKLSAPPSWNPSEKVQLGVQGRYLHGGAMSAREVRWTAYRESEPFQAASLPGFVFGSSEREPLRQAAEGEGKLDGDGHLSVSFQPEPASQGPVRFTVDATVTDVDRQTSTGRLWRVVHPAPLYLGLKPPAQQVLSAGSTLEVPVAAVSPGGQPRPGVEVRLELRRVEHHSTVRMLGRDRSELTSQPVVSSATECQVVTQAVPVSCRFSLTEAGQFEVLAQAREGAAAIHSRFALAVAGENAVAWPRFDHSRFQLVADKPSYRPGETARLLAQSPFGRARGLLTVESGGVLSHRLISIEGNTPTIELPIGEELVPNAFVSLVLLRGREHHQKDAVGFETGAPAFKVGYAELKVEPVSRRLQVSVRPRAPVLKPKGQLELEISVRDPSGQPVPAQATVAVVDEAVLSLTAFRTPDPVSQLSPPRSLGVRTADGRLDLVHARRARHEALFPGGDGAEGLSLPLAGDLRNLFRSTAYWNPRVPVGADGVARLSVTLPDNLTTFRVMAVVADQRQRAGSGEAKVMVRKPLMVRPALPRFVYPGDRFQLEAIAFNGGGSAGTVQLSLSRAEGLTPEPGASTSRALDLPAGASASLRVPVTVTGRQPVTVRFEAKLGAETDAVEVKLPVLDVGVRQVLVASTQPGQGGEVALELPPHRVSGSTELEVVLSTSSLTELADSVQSLMQYPNGCIEQTTSTAYPQLVLQDLLPRMGLTVDEIQLRRFSEAGVKRLLSFQTSSGGLAYWPGSDAPHAFGTTFGLTALLEAKKRGFEVPESALQKMAEYLERALQQGTISQEMPHGGMPDADTRALMVMTLNRLGRPKPSYVSTLWREKEKLTPFGMAMLGVAIHEGAGDRALLPPVLAEVRRQAKESQAEAWYEGERDQGWSMGSPLRTHAAALLAFAQAGGGSEAGPKLLTGLLKRKNGYGIWGNTQENVYGVMGVVALVGSGAEGQGPAGTLRLGGKLVELSGGEKLSASALRFSRSGKEVGLADAEPSRFTASFEKQGGAPVSLTARARFEVPLTGEVRAPKSNGFTVRHRYETLEGESLEGKPVPLGSVVRVRLSVQSAQQRNYVAIDDKLPAGLEPLNPNLATTERLSLGPATPASERALAALSYQEMRDARVAFYANQLPSGELEYVYLARATTPGRFLRPPASAEAMYDPEVTGRSAIDEIQVVGR